MASTGSVSVDRFREVDLESHRCTTTEKDPPDQSVSWVRFVTPILGLYISYTLSNIVQEELFSFSPPPVEMYDTTVMGDHFESASLLTMTKSTICVLITSVIHWARGGTTSERSGINPLKSSITIPALIKCVSSISTMYSLNFISYPQAMMGKCVKIIPIMVFEMMYDRRLPSTRRMLSATVVTMGIVLFSSNPLQIEGENIDGGGVGWALISLSLILEGILAVSQKRMITSNPGVSNTMMVSNLWQMAVSGSMVIFNWGEKGGILFVFENTYVISLLVVCALIETMGQFFLFSLLLVNGPVVTAIVTTTRKFFTILVSVCIFGHRLSVTQWLGGMVVFFGLMVDVFRSHSGTRNVPSSRT